MKKFSLRPISSNSWILTENGNRIGLVSQMTDNIKILGNIEQKTHNNLDNLQKYLGGSGKFSYFFLI